MKNEVKIVKFFRNNNNYVINNNLYEYINILFILFCDLNS